MGKIKLFFEGGKKPCAETQDRKSVEVQFFVEKGDRRG